jgi:hypothetical protein
MANIAYVDHSFHQKTVSTKFLPDALTAAGHTIDFFWDSGWQGGEKIQWSQVKHHDIILMFQSYCDTGGTPFSELHKNVIYIPMLDQFGMWEGPRPPLDKFWRLFRGSKVLNFSSAQHAVTLAYGTASHYVRYYPEVMPEPVERESRLRGFLWARNNNISWPLVKALIGNAKFEHFQLHIAPDPGAPEAILPSQEDIRNYNISTSTWFNDKSEFEQIASKANVFFAPRLGEGIGQSFLEAMNRGQCVVAANQGTMNEYILSGINGLLYDHKAPVPLDFTNVGKIGRTARESILQGERQWKAAIPDMVNFIETPSSEFYPPQGKSVSKSKNAFRSALMHLRRK